MTDQRRLAAIKVRQDAAALAAGRIHPQHKANADEQRYASANYPMNFTKGLHHNTVTGLVETAQDFEAFRKAVDNGFVEAFTSAVPVPHAEERRHWEAPTAGLVFELQGPDSQAVTMAPAPALCSSELAFEMAEVYELSLLRDEPFNRFDNGGGSAKLTQAITRMNNLTYAKEGFKARPRLTADDGKLDRQTAFRGSSPGVDKGPYLSQFLIIGTANSADGSKTTDGFIHYGAQCIDQKVLEAKSEDDYMMKWEDWYRVQQGYDVQANTDKCKPRGPGQSFTGNRRFIYTPRDLATYVHMDQLYQAYLNACLILLNNKTPMDPAFNLLSGGADISVHSLPNGNRVPLNTSGFALWGGPHILSLVTEVATRGLKAVRYQKFNNHLRLRPEALAARIEKADEIEARFPTLCGCFSEMAKELKSVLEEIQKNNLEKAGAETSLLPMAFQEGSPMHPAYGAGHATVAGACVTILKAFFDTSAVFARIDQVAGFYSTGKIKKALECGSVVDAGAYQVFIDNGDTELNFTPCGEYTLTDDGCGKSVIYTPNDKNKDCCPLTLEGELNKLAANISIGRNMAGVHYYSDYYDSLRMGEEVAIGILQEQALCYSTDPCVMSLSTFDGQVIRIGNR